MNSPASLSDICLSTSLPTCSGTADRSESLTIGDTFETRTDVIESEKSQSINCFGHDDEHLDNAFEKMLCIGRFQLRRVQEELRKTAGVLPMS